LIGPSILILIGDEAATLIDTKLLPTITSLVDSLRKQDIVVTNKLQVPYRSLPSVSGSFSSLHDATASILKHRGKTLSGLYSFPYALRDEDVQIMMNSIQTQNGE
jgi:hypothetical protein